MPLSPDTRLGAYRITAQIGAGGMGEVYRARDLTLERDVAIKVLPENFAQDPERLARFEREARTLAALNHPNIAQIYGFERSGSVAALVMELVEGETLGSNGPMPLDEALSLAKQIASALEIAHEQGIVHRDLKPANIKVRSDGTVKVLDFGLAKALEPVGVAGSSQPDQAFAMTQSPTLTFQATQAGLILGTAAYMSPEQARGKPADKRADIWSFGVVLFEMLSGGRLFDGEDVSETLAFVLTKTPEWSKLPATVPPAIVTLLKRCLERDRQRRVADMSTVRFVIEETGSLVAALPHAHESASPSTTVRPLWRRLVPLGSAIVLTAAVAAAVASAVWPRSSAPVSRFAITLSSDQRLTGSGRRLLALSPDGTRLVYVANDRLFLRPMMSLEASPIGDSGASNLRITGVVFSPDGQSVAFFSTAERAIKRIAVSGGIVSSTVCPGGENAPLGMWWDATGIIFGAGARGIMRCPANGGSPQQLVAASANEWLVWPQLLHDGDTLLFATGKPESLATGATASDEATVVTQSLRTGTRTVLVRNASAPRYVETGHLLYVQRGIVFAAPFNPAHPAEIGGAAPVIEGVRRFPGPGYSPQYDVSATGSMAYIPGPARFATGQVLLVAADRTGKFDRLFPDAGAYQHPRLSRDGKYVAYSTTDGQDSNVWVFEVGSSRAARRLTTFGGRNLLPIWSGDGSRVAYQSNKEGDLAIFAQRFDGTDSAERLTKPAQGVSHVPESWSPDGQFLTFDEVKGTSHSLFVLSIADKKVTPTRIESIEPFESSFSPDGKWLAYFVRRSVDTQSADRGTYVQRFPLTGLPQQVPKINVDFHPVWTRDGKGLVYVATAGNNLFVEVSVATSTGVTFGSAATFAAPVQDRVSNERREFDILPDGRFIGLVPIDRTESLVPNAGEIRVVLNWFEELKSRVPVK